MIEQSLKGYAATIFAFGQTGSGKTYTITGPDGVEPEKKGLTQRAFAEIFRLIGSDKNTKYTVRATYLEIYLEQVKDLLNPTSGNLQIRWNSERGFYVENLFVVDCEVLDDCMAVLEEGLRNRKTAAHKLNEDSSRSHSILTIYIDSQMTDSEDGRVVLRHGKLSIVDLAGSEKVKESKAIGDTFAETLNINKSLLTLG